MKNGQNRLTPLMCMSSVFIGYLLIDTYVYKVTAYNPTNISYVIWYIILQCNEYCIYINLYDITEYEGLIRIFGICLVT